MKQETAIGLLVSEVRNMERKEAIRSAYRLTSGNNFYDGMITCSTMSGKAVCRLVWDMNKAENDAYLEKALSGIMNLIDRFLIDGYWVGHTNAWTILGTEDLKPYINAKDKQKKWLFGTVGMASIAAVLAAMMTVQ